MFLGFKKAARESVKAGSPHAFAITASSKFVKGAYTKDAAAEHLKLSAPAIYTASGPEGGWTRCKIGRPTESTVEVIAAAVGSCVAATGGKAEL